MREAFQRFGGAIVPGALWLWVCWHLHDEWTLNPQYNYGWAVPFLAALLFYLRWPGRPVAGKPPHGAVVAVAMWILLVLLLPIRAIEEANPDWRLLSWTLALIVAGYSLLALYRTGGKRPCGTLRSRFACHWSPCRGRCNSRMWSCRE